MLVVGTGGNLFFYLQAWAIFSARSAADVSLPAFCVAFWAVTSWLAYGLARRDRLIVIANAFAMLGAGLVIAGCLVHG